MDLHIEETRGRRADITVDLADAAGEFTNDASVTADVYFVPTGSGQASLRQVRTLKLEQTAPGRYEHPFQLADPGVYLVRAISGSDVASVGLVSNVSAEVALGQVDQALLERVCQATGGKLLRTEDIDLPQLDSGALQYQELAPLLLRVLLLLFLADVVIRRWENLLGVVELFPQRGRKR